MDLTRLNPVLLITGAGSGLGAACARKFAHRAEGGLILVDSDADELDAVADSLEKPPERVSTLAFDVADQERWLQAQHFMRDQYGRLDWAVVNAGASGASLITDTDLAERRRVTSTSIESAFQSLRAVMPLMRSNADGGAIVVTATAAALSEGAGGKAKIGLLQLMRAAAQEGAPGGIRVNAIAPGGAVAAWRDAPLFQDLARKTGSESATLDEIGKLPTPLARYSGSEDITPLITMLLSDESSINGATLVVDGGYTI